MKISAVVLTKNEEKNIEKCLKSLDFCEEILIIDDHSTDKTLEVIKNYKVKIFKRKLHRNFAEQRNFGLGKASNEWVLFIDADEEISKDLRNEISNLDTIQVSEIDAFYLKRRDFFWGKELKYGEIKEVRRKGLIRLVKKNGGKWLGNVHEIYHTARNTKRLNGFINHYPHQNLKEFIQRINFYSSLRSQELFTKGKKTNIFEIIIWPLGKFINSYLLNLGFLDGPQGFTYSFLMSFHSFLVRAKLYLML